MHESVADKCARSFWRAYKTVPIGNPLDAKTLMGPLIDRAGGRQLQHAHRSRLKDEGGKFFTAANASRAKNMPAVVT